MSLRFYAKSKFCVCFEVHIPVAISFRMIVASFLWVINVKNIDDLVIYNQSNVLLTIINIVQTRIKFV